jgi:hypothetical protein
LQHQGNSDFDRHPGEARFNGRRAGQAVIQRLEAVDRKDTGFLLAQE